MSDARLSVDPDPEVWFLGPDDERGPEQWCAEALEMLLTTFGVPRRKRSKVEPYLNAMLERMARPDGNPLPYRLIRWLRLGDSPFGVHFGMAYREEVEEFADEFLLADDISTVEQPIVEDVDAPDGVGIRRTICYGEDEEGLLVEVRYLVDTGDPDAMVVVHAVHPDAGVITGALADIDAFARTARIVHDG